jgi:hypothetical protein
MGIRDVGVFRVSRRCEKVIVEGCHAFAVLRGLWNEELCIIKCI